VQRANADKRHSDLPQRGCGPDRPRNESRIQRFGVSGGWCVTTGSMTQTRLMLAAAAGDHGRFQETPDEWWALNGAAVLARKACSIQGKV